MMHALEHFTDGFVVLEGLFCEGSGIQWGVALVHFFGEAAEGLDATLP